MAKNIEVKIIGDASGFKSALNAAEGHLGKFTSILQGVGQGVGQALAGGVSQAVSGTVGFLQDAIGGASDLAETVSKTGVLFGGSAGEVLEWSKTTAGALGQSRQQALDAASTFATFGKSAGLTDGRLVDFSKSMTGLASDLASFNNTSPDDAIQAIGAALRGESEPIRRFGVLLDEATLRERAFKLGLISTTKEALTPQQKVLAAQAEIMAQTTAAQGDFARTSEGLANKQRILAARFADAKAQIGTALLPAVLAIADVILTKVIPAVEKFAGWVQRIADIFRDSGWKEAAKEVLKQVGEAFSALGAWIRDSAAPALWEALKSMAKALAAWVIDPALPWLLEHLGQWLAAFGGWIVGTAVPWLAGQVVDLAVALAGWVGDSAKRLRDNLPEWLRTFTQWMVSEAIPAAVVAVAKFGVKMADWVLTATAQMLANLPGWIAGFVGWVNSSAVPALILAGGTLAKAIAAGLWGALNFMGSIANAIVEGIIRGLWSLAGRMSGAVRDFIRSTIPDQVRGLLGISSPSKVMFELGQRSVEGLRLGMEAGKFSVATASASVAQSAYRATARAGPPAAFVGAGVAAGPSITLNGVVAGSETQLAAYLNRALRTYNMGRR